MQTIKAKPALRLNNPAYRFVTIAIILSILFVIGLYINNAVKAFSSPVSMNSTTVITQGELEERYGLRINLIALTAAGGFVDVRLKIMDGEKAKLLLVDKSNFPTLNTEGGVVLNAPEETKSQDIQFITGGNLFIIYPNSANAIKQAASVRLVFGDISVESIQVR